MHKTLTRTLFVLFSLLVLGGVAATASHAQPITASLSFDRDRYRRGEVVTATVTVRWAYSGQRVPAGMGVDFHNWSDHRPNGSYLTTVYTDGAGQARIRYRVPTDPREDNVHIAALARNYYWNGYYWEYHEAFAYKRIPIG